METSLGTEPGSRAGELGSVSGSLKGWVIISLPTPFHHLCSAILGLHCSLSLLPFRVSVLPFSFVWWSLLPFTAYFLRTVVVRIVMTCCSPLQSVSICSCSSYFFVLACLFICSFVGSLSVVWSVVLSVVLCELLETLSCMFEELGGACLRNLEVERLVLK